MDGVDCVANSDLFDAASSSDQRKGVGSVNNVVYCS